MGKMLKNVDNVNEKGLLLTRAQGAVLSHDFTTAARLYKQLLADDPSNVDYLKELGSIYVKNGEDSKAIPYYEQIITFYPHYIEAMNSLGAIYRRLKKYDESIAILQKAVDEGRQTASVNYNLGFTYKEMGNYDDAIEAFQSVISENPADVLAHNHLGSIYLAKKEYEKSINAFRRGLQIDQNHPILNYNLARCYQEAKQYNDAIRCYETALKAKPGWIEPVRDFSELLIECQKTKEAADIVRNSIILHPHDAKLLCTMGQIYLNEFDYESAEKTFKKANSIDSQNKKILSGLAESLEKGGKPLDALDAVEKALQIEPEDKAIRKQYVSALLSAGEYDSANQNVIGLYKNKGDRDPQVLDLCGQYCICTEKDDKAKLYYDKIKLVNRHYKEHILAAADRYSQIGKEAEAEQYAKEYISKRSENPAGYNTLGKIYAKSGNYKEAIDSYNKSRELRKPNILADKQISKLQKYLDESKNEPVEEPVVQDEVVEPQTEVVEEAPAEAEDEFDFGTMGDNVPMGEALLEEEKDFFDELDEATGDIEPDEDFFEEEEEEEPEEEKQPEIKIDTGSGKNDFADSDNKASDIEDKPSDSSNGLDFSDLENEEDVSPFDNLDYEQPATQAQQLVPDAELPEDDNLKPSFLDDIQGEDSFDFDQFDDSYAEEKSDKKDKDLRTSFDGMPYDDTPGFEGFKPEPKNNPSPKDIPPKNYQEPQNYQQDYPSPDYQPDNYQPKNYPQPDFQPNYPPQNYPPKDYQSGPDYRQQPDYPGYFDDMQRNMQNSMMDSARYAMDAAMNAQKMANDLARQQQQLLEEQQELKEQLQEEIESKVEQAKDDIRKEMEPVINSPVDEEKAFIEEIEPEEELLEDLPEEIEESIYDSEPHLQAKNLDDFEIDEIGLPDDQDMIAEQIMSSSDESESLDPDIPLSLNEPEDEEPEDVEDFTLAEPDCVIEDDDPLQNNMDNLPEIEDNFEADNEAENNSENDEEDLEIDGEQEFAADPSETIEDNDGLFTEINDDLEQSLNQIEELDEQNFSDQFDDIKLSDFEIGEEKQEADESNDIDNDEVILNDIEEVPEEETEEEPEAEDKAAVSDAEDETSSEDKDFDFVLDEFVDVLDGVDEMEENEVKNEEPLDEYRPDENQIDEPFDEPQVDEVSDELPVNESLPEETLVDEDSFETDDTILEEVAPPDIQEEMNSNPDSFIVDEKLAEVDLFKKLLSLSEYLPEDKKDGFKQGKTRMQMEYLISKMSGKPGLLKTVMSLSAPESNENAQTGEYSEEILRSVLQTMKNLSQSLEDKSLSKSLCDCVDSVLSKL
ncbi:MAG: tetratricopeptide repeat protein [Treponema sp.]|nr:tetratricopeptide repeat protein [Treponema sp.]